MNAYVQKISALNTICVVFITLRGFILGFIISVRDFIISVS